MPAYITRIIDVECHGMHSLQKNIVGTLVQDWTKPLCLAAGLIALVGPLLKCTKINESHGMAWHIQWRMAYMPQFIVRFLEHIGIIQRCNIAEEELSNNTIFVFILFM